jgi:hypothetical protein
MKELMIEISYTFRDDDYPEHEGFYESVEEAKEALDRIAKLYEEADEDGWI